MWLHEQQFNKYCAEYDTLPSYRMKIEDFWEEYGNLVVYCSYTYENIEAGICEEESDFCVAIINTNIVNNFVPIKNRVFCLYMPYRVKLVRYKSALLKCFCDISRISMYNLED